MDSGETSDTTTINNLFFLHPRALSKHIFFLNKAGLWPAGLQAVVCGWAVALINRDHLPAPASRLWMEPRWDRSATPEQRAKKTFTRWPKDLEECDSDQYSWGREELTKQTSIFLYLSKLVRNNLKRDVKMEKRNRLWVACAIEALNWWTSPFYKLLNCSIWMNHFNFHSVK